MAGVKPPLYYSYQGREDVIQMIALREYFSSISVFSEIMSFHEKSQTYPKNLIIEYMAHVIHLALQMSAFDKKFIDEILELKNKENQMEMFQTSYSLFKRIQGVMKQKGFLKISGSYRMNNSEKGAGMALGYG